MPNPPKSWRTRMPNPLLRNNFNYLRTDRQIMYEKIGDPVKGKALLKEISPVFHRIISGIYFRTKRVIIVHPS
jgi:hypothetical protein